MKVIATPYVNDVADQIKSYDVGIVLDDLTAGALIDYVSNCTDEYMSDADRRQALLDDVCFENRLEKFKKFICGE